jgi:hypothetical protein
MKVCNSDGFVISGWSIKPYSFTHIEENEIVVTVTNDPEFMFDEVPQSVEVTLRELCYWNLLNVHDVFNDMRQELDNFIFV